MIYNVILYTVSAFIFGDWLITLYSIIAFSVGIKIIDMIVEGIDKGKSVIVITHRDTKLAGILTEELGRGVTVLEAVGGYSNDDKIFIYCVVNRFEITQVKKIVKENDANAFVTITEVSETVGGSDISFKLGISRN